MKVRITVMLDVDAEGWASTYGITGDEVRADVKEYIEQVLVGLHPNIEKVTVQ